MLAITVWDHPELTGPGLPSRSDNVDGQVGPPPATFVIDQQGNLHFPFAGAVPLAGLTREAARDRLAQRLARYFRTPRVTLAVMAYRSQRVYVDGQVRMPGPQAINDIPMTLREALNRAGGLLPTADQSRITVERAGRRYRIDLLAGAAAATPDAPSAAALVDVPAAMSATTPLVNSAAMTARTGREATAATHPATSAPARSSAPAPSAWPKTAPAAPGHSGSGADHAVSATMLLADGDVVRAPPRDESKVFVGGEVLSPRALPMHDGRLTLGEALGEVGGLNPQTADASQVYVVRRSRPDGGAREDMSSSASASVTPGASAPVSAPASPASAASSRSPLVYWLDARSASALALAEQFELQPRDVVYVAASTLTNWHRAISQLFPGELSSAVGVTTRP
ncbi:hypothetical protein ASF61_08565 [Duganella sp. Leaf126]|nr:hypothetical protein ASF61_08565 [Duganella sp. Leaf126]